MLRINSINNLCRQYLVLNIVKKLKFSEFLELGIGDGKLIRRLAKMGYRGRGIDISKEAIATASALLKNYTNINIERADLFKTYGHFDLIIMLQVLEHLRDDSVALRKVRELLSPCGYLILSVPAHKKKWGYIDIVGGHHRRYEKEALDSLLEQEGLKIKFFWSYGFPIINLVRPWEEFFYKRYFISNCLDSKSQSERTQESGLINVPWVMGFPEVFNIFINEIVFYPFLLTQELWLNTDWGLNYLILAKTS